MYPKYTEQGIPQWIAYADEIQSAKIEVTGATNLCSLFKGCSNLTSVDVNSLDTSNVTGMEFMFYKCSGLTIIYTPQKTSSVVAELPGETTWIDRNGKVWKELPANATESIVLTKTEDPYDEW